MFLSDMSLCILICARFLCICYTLPQSILMYVCEVSDMESSPQKTCGKQCKRAKFSGSQRCEPRLGPWFGSVPVRGRDTLLVSFFFLFYSLGYTVWVYLSGFQVVSYGKC